MPELDETSEYRHLSNLCHEYQQLVELIESGRLETEEIRHLNGERSVLHDQIMEEMQRLRIAFDDRDDARRKAFKLAKWVKSDDNF